MALAQKHALRGGMLCTWGGIVAGSSAMLAQGVLGRALPYQLTTGGAKELRV